MYVKQIKVLAPEPNLVGALKRATFVLLTKNFILRRKTSFKFSLTSLVCPLKKLKDVKWQKVLRPQRDLILAASAQEF